MPLRNAQPVSFFPLGLADSLEQLSAFPGACQSLSNVVFDRQNRGAVVSRPGVINRTTFSGFTSPGAVSAAISVGTRIYGLVAVAGGTDYPFCWDTSVGAFVTIAGATGANTPTTQATSGAWTPPSCDVVGTKVVFTHPGFSGSNFFGWIDISNPSAPVWSAGNTATNALPSPPVWVQQFFNRAYFFCGNVAYFSDSLNATNINNTNFAGALTLGDTSPIIGASGLAFSTSSAGILSSLAVFKANSIYQISGDITGTGSTALSLNIISANIGCSAPRTAASTPQGIYFIASDGPRLIDLRGQLEYVQAEDGKTPDIVVPFANATTISRACGAYNNGIYRVCLDTIVAGKQIIGADYWFDTIFSRWTGPHSFSYSVAVPVANVFYLASPTSVGLFSSEVTASATTGYQDNGANYSSSVASDVLIHPSEMSETAVIESTIELGKSSAGSSYSVIAQDGNGNLLNQLQFTYSPVAAVYGTAIYGVSTYATATITSQVTTIPWTQPLVFKKLQVTVSGTASSGFSMRETKHRFQTLGYTNA
jgi:hypothetical protein